MKKRLITITTVLVLMTTLIALVGCKSEDPKNINNNIGNSMPTISPSVKINSGMSAKEMYLAGVNNYNTADYAASHQTGEIATATGFGTTVQALSIRKISDGGKVYMDNTSFTIKEIAGINIKLADELYADASGARYRASDKCTMEDGVLSVKKWKTTANYADLNAMLKVVPNDPSRINMYIIDESTILTSTQPEYDRKMKQYSFSFTLDAVKASVDYDPVVKDQLANNGFSSSQVTYNTLKFDVVMWENGFIRSVSVNETYAIKAKKGILSITGDVTSNANVNYTYNKNEMRISEYLKF